MASSTTMTVKAGECMRNVTLDVKISGYRMMQVRVWIGMKIVRFGVWIVGCGIRVEEDE